MRSGCALRASLSLLSVTNTYNIRAGISELTCETVSVAGYGVGRGLMYANICLQVCSVCNVTTCGREKRLRFSPMYFLVVKAVL